MVEQEAFSARTERAQNHEQTRHFLSSFACSIYQPLCASVRLCFAHGDNILQVNTAVPSASFYFLSTLYP